MGYGACNDAIRDNITRMRRDWEAQRGVLTAARLQRNPLSQTRRMVLAENWPPHSFQNIIGW